MAAVRTLVGLVAAGLLLAACGKPAGIEIPAKPLVQLHILVEGDLATLTPLDGGVDAGEVDAGEVDAGEAAVDAGPLPTQLHAALVWGLQWLPEPFCVLPVPGAEALQAAGCRDSFGFVPTSVAVDTPITPGVPATLDLFDLPKASVMVGDITGRIAYASVYVYQDRNGNGVLDLRHPELQHGHREGDNQDPGGAADAVYGASFISMTLPDQRVAYLEGDFSKLVDVAFYPRTGCAVPPEGFSILSAGGFSAAAALATMNPDAGLPVETGCGESGLGEAIVIPLRDQAGLADLACTTNDEGGVTYYRKPPDAPPDTRNRASACVPIPRIDNGNVSYSGQQLVVSGHAYGPSLDPCKFTQHYILSGCQNDAFCAIPAWTVSPSQVPWWPCAATP
jgi:hypothetical protein